MKSTVRTRIKWWLFPGLNLHARQRYRVLPEYFTVAAPGVDRYVLDAGCGNGMLAYQSYLKGNRVVGITFKEKEVQGCKDLFNTYLGIPEERLRFRQGNLYELDFPPETFDEIICSEVLEHLQRDTVVCKTFQRLLKPEGILHVCAPNAEHPYNAAFPLDEQEKGGHVRAGYTLDGYRNLLEPLGFKIVKSAGLGGPIRQAFNWRIKEIQAKYGTITGLPLFVIFFLLLPLERRWSESNSPFSIYVKAVNKG